VSKEKELWEKSRTTELSFEEEMEMWAWIDELIEGEKRRFFRHVRRCVGRKGRNSGGQ
jgi:hypothetical protein